MHRDKDGEKIADVLGHEAFEMGADMMATGAFGHSRAYDFVIGAATRSLLSDAKLPVMFSKQQFIAQKCGNRGQRNSGRSRLVRLNQRKSP